MAKPLSGGRGKNSSRAREQNAAFGAPNMMTEIPIESIWTRLRRGRSPAPGTAWRLAGVFAGLLWLLAACSTSTQVVAPAQRIEGANYVGDKVCAECHQTVTRRFPSSPHARLRVDGIQLPSPQGCEACHGPASRHIAVGGGRGKFILNPGRQPEACFDCHLETQAQFHFPQHHPVLEGKMNCVQCHDPHGRDILKPAGGPAFAQLNQTCAPCHREQTKPAVFEHAALREGCGVCHQPHGSINAKMLIVRDANLCLRCHAQVQGPNAAGSGIFIGRVNHSSFLAYGTCWTAGCHRAVHGSNVNPHLLF